MISIAAYLTAVRITLDRRNHQTWDQLVGRVDQGLGRGASFRNAGVLLEMIDYACRAEKSIDTALAELLRTEAMRMRLESLLVPKSRA